MTSYILSMDTSVRLLIPVGHVIMVSVYHMDILGRYDSCKPDAYVSFHDSDDFSRELRVLCGNTIPGPEVYDLDSGVFYVRFLSRANYKAVAGFRLQFSFYPRSARPLRLPDGTWNCSVANWPDFRHHFPCNLRAECARGEDEEQCPYNRPRCGRGRLSVGGRCYYIRSFQRLEKLVSLSILREGYVRVSWKAAEERCRQEGGHLASLSSYREMADVRQLLFSSDDEPFFIGMIPVERSVPYL